MPVPEVKKSKTQEAGFQSLLEENKLEVIVTGFQAKDGQKRANGRDLRFPDGKLLFMGSSGTPGAPDETKQQP